jgi:hypothetical protein
MDTKIDKKCNCKEFLQVLIKDCFDKLIGSDIFVLTKKEEKKVENKKSFSQMDINEISSALESFDDICHYNKDFAQLRIEFLSLKYKLFDIFHFRQYIRNSHSGYYYKKALFFFILKVILIIAGILLTLLLDYPRNVCTQTLFDEKKDKSFWIYNGKKYKVDTIERDREWNLRLAYFILFDLFYALLEFSFLLTLQRVKVNIFFILTFQLLKFFCNVTIIVFTFCRENYCENSDNDKNIFYIKNNILEKILIIEDIIKFLIN